ncbi:hypothetical protein D3C73_1600630 [compost metagenome]
MFNTEFFLHCKDRNPPINVVGFLHKIQPCLSNTVNSRKRFKFCLIFRNDWNWILNRRLTI